MAAPACTASTEPVAKGSLATSALTSAMFLIIYIQPHNHHNWKSKLTPTISK